MTSLLGPKILANLKFLFVEVTGYSHDVTLLLSPEYNSRRNISFIAKVTMVNYLFSSLTSGNDFKNFLMRKHGGSLNKLYCVTRVFYISVTMRKIIPFTSLLLSFSHFGMHGLF